MLHPIGFFSGNKPFQPTDIPGLALWLDAADSSTITQVSGAVSQWSDKSGNGWHSVQATAGNRPTYSNGQLIFSGVNVLVSPLSGFVATTGATWFVTFDLDNTSQNTGVFGTNGIDEYDRFPGNGKQYPGRFRSVRIEQYRDFPASGPHLLSGCTSSSFGWEEWLNGTSGGNRTVNFQAPIDVTIGNIRATTNGSGDPPKWLTGKIGDVLIYSSVLSSANRQIVEGYLAWKRNRQGSLPAGHPYKNLAP